MAPCFQDVKIKIRTLVRFLIDKYLKKTSGMMAIYLQVMMKFSLVIVGLAALSLL